MELTEHQRSQVKGAHKLATKMTGKCVLIEAYPGGGEDYVWVHHVDVIPDTMGAEKFREVRLFIWMTYKVNRYGRLKKFPTPTMQYRSLMYIDGGLYQQAPGGSLTNAVEEITYEIQEDDVIEVLPPQYYGHCPQCHKRHSDLWFSKGAGGSRDTYPSPPDRYGAFLTLECTLCGYKAPVNQWDCKKAPRKWLFTAKKPMALKGVS